MTSHLRGILLRPGETGYEDARQVYNAMINKQRALIARCVDVDDVIAAVDFAIDLHVKYGAQLPTMLSGMHLYPINGAVQRARDYWMALHPYSAGGAMST